MYDTAAESTSNISFDSVDPFYDSLPWFRLIGRYVRQSNFLSQTASVIGHLPLAAPTNRGPGNFSCKFTPILVPKVFAVVGFEASLIIYPMQTTVCFSLL